MIEPRRYLDDAEAPAEARELLRSAANDGLDAPRTAAIARALGIADGPPAPPTGPRGGAWLIGGAAVAGLVALVVLAATHRDVPAPTPAVVTTPPPVAMPAPTTPPSDAVSVADLPEAPPILAAPSVRLAPSAVVVDDLPAQLRALEEVRRALVEHRTADARDGLSRYDRTFSKKQLAAEERVLDMETLFAEGRTTDARSKARAFLVAAPDSPYAARIRSLLAEQP